MSIPFEVSIRDAESINIKLEMIKGIPVWEASPVFQHQWELDRIRASIRRLEPDRCACISIADVLFKFPDGSQKRPDIAILCAMPDRSTTETALEIIPAAVVEIISKTYEYKDLVLAPPFYLENGIRDILIFNPADNSVLHYRPDFEQPKTYTSPITLSLECGCEITV
jgi:Uma2 family endonuclease